MKLSQFNQDFISQMKAVTGRTEDEIIEGIVCYYRAIKTVRRQLGKKDLGLVEFGESGPGLLEGEDLQVYLLAYLKKAEEEA